MEIQWTLVLFSSVAGAGACLFAASALGELLNKEKEPGKVEAIVAFILLVVGGFLSVLHLKHPDRILEALNRPTSGIFIEAALIGIMCAIIAVYFIMVVRGTSAKARKVVAAIGLIVGIFFAYECGSSYMMEARPAWMTVSLPLAYFGTVASAGAAGNLLIKALLKREKESIRFASLESLVAGIIGILTAAIFCFSSGGALLASEQSLMIWVIVLFAALIIACIFSLLAMRQPEKAQASAVMAVFCGCVEAVTIRAFMWVLGTPIMDIFLMPLD